MVVCKLFKKLVHHRQNEPDSHMDSPPEIGFSAGFRFLMVDMWQHRGLRRAANGLMTSAKPSPR